MMADMSKLRPNRANELLLDMSYTNDGKSIYIYDLSMYLDAHDCADRRRRLKNVSYKFVGTRYTVFAINIMGDISKDLALKVATAVIDGNINYYRLD